MTNLRFILEILFFIIVGSLFIYELIKMSKKLNWISIICCVCGIVVVLYMLINFVIDIPKLYRKDYSEVQGIVTQINGGKGGIGFKLDNTIGFNFYITKNAKKGDLVHVVYLPNSKFVIKAWVVEN